MRAREPTGPNAIDVRFTIRDSGPGEPILYYGGSRTDESTPMGVLRIGLHGGVISSVLDSPGFPKREERPFIRFECRFFSWLTTRATLDYAKLRTRLRSQPQDES